MTQKRRVPAKATGGGEAPPSIRVEPAEKAIVDRTLAKVHSIASQFDAARAELNTALELVGARYGVDLRSGRYNIAPDGQLIEVVPAPGDGRTLLNE